MTNHLADESSLYLRHHAENPVDWYPWGDEPLALARAADRPLLVSIGYAACHWCHVMERESFASVLVADAINRDFVAIKVDREERPDLDQVYMAATQALNEGRGGWPMTVFCTPLGEPFFAGTYFPPVPQAGMPSFTQVLAAIAKAWRLRRGELVGQAASLRAALADHARPAPSTNPGGDLLTASAQAAWTARCVDQLAARFDDIHGGFGGAPKFPPASQLALLLRLAQQGDDPRPWSMARATLQGMARGGMHDLVGGGFARYSTCEAWFVPHFEKMLTDNALLAGVYALAHAQDPGLGFGSVAARTADWMLAEMVLPGGGLATSVDADDPGGEGAYYAWRPAEVAAALAGRADAQQAAAVCRRLAITEAGTWEGGRSLPRLAAGDGDGDGQRHQEEGYPLAKALEALAAARRRRPAPARDDKCVVAYNGLAMTGLATVARALRAPRYLAAGCRVAAAVWGAAWRDDRGLARLGGADSAREGPAGLLEDYAYLGEGLVALYEAGGPCALLAQAEAVAEALLARFLDPASGALCETAADQPPLLFRPIEAHDGATPSAAATACGLLTRLAVHCHRPSWRAAAGGALAAHADGLARAPQAHCRALVALAEPQDHWAVVRPPDADPDPWRDPLWAEVAGALWPDRVLAHGAGQASQGRSHLLLGHQAVGGRSTLWVCDAQGCLPPRHEV